MTTKKQTKQQKLDALAAEMIADFRSEHPHLRLVDELEKRGLRLSRRRDNSQQGVTDK